MHKQFWFVLGFLSCLFASGFAMAEEGPEKWWVVVIRAEPTLCGQTTEGQLLCLHAESLSSSGASFLRRAGTAEQDWAFLGNGSGPI